MKNLSFLKGLFVGVAIATIGAVAYAKNVSSSFAEAGTIYMEEVMNSFGDYRARGMVATSWVVLNDGVYYCALVGQVRGENKAGCRKVPMVGEFDSL